MAQNVYPAYGHPEGIGAAPWFTIRGDNLSPAYGHPEGIGAAPCYRIEGLPTFSLLRALRAHSFALSELEVRLLLSSCCCYSVTVF